ncbi:MAG: ABC transporter permease [Gammaproteobacteria bacterium]
MSLLRQTAEITRVGLSTLPQRRGPAAVIVVGIAGVVAVLVALLAMAEGFRTVLVESGRMDEAIVLRKGATAELNSTISRAHAALVAQVPGIARSAAGTAILSPEVVVVANLPKKATGTDANVQIRGVNAAVWDLRSSVVLTSGRRFTPGLRELVVGAGARQQFQGLSVGSVVRLANGDWTVVGEFRSGDTHDSELWGDAEAVMSTYRRNAFQSITVKLADADAFDAFVAGIATDRRLELDVERTRDYYAGQSEELTRVIRVLGLIIASIMAVGAVFGALNTMYTAVAIRAREIATLRAIGFPALPVVASVLAEAALLATAGGLAGGTLAWLLFDAYEVSTLGSNFSQVVFAFRVTPALLAQGLAWALAIGLAGGLLPALKAARQPVAVALREL